MNNNPSVKPMFPQKKDNRNIIYAILIIALLGTWGYIFYDKSKAKETVNELKTQITNIDSARNAVQIEFNEATAKLDSLTSSNIQMQGSLAEKNNDIQQKKAEIRAILNKKNATSAELAQARELISELNGKIDGLFAEVEKLKAENQLLTSTNEQLNTEKQQLTSDKQNLEQNLTKTSEQKKKLEQKVDIASTLHAVNINITAIDIRNNGKEKETTTAKRADLFRISFEIDENRVAPTGTKEMYVLITGPDGKAFSEGIFDTREDGQREYTNKVSVNYEQGKRMPVSFNWKPNHKYETGVYKIEIYHNGYKIGEGNKALKKGGLFS